MPDPRSEEGPLERLGEEVFPARDGKGLGPTLGPGLSSEHQAELVERIVGEQASFQGHGLPPRAPMSGAARSAGGGAVSRSGDDASLGSGAVREHDIPAADEPDGLNEAEAEVFQQAQAEEGRPRAPDETRVALDRGENDSEGL